MTRPPSAREGSLPSRRDLAQAPRPPLRGRDQDYTLRVRFNCTMKHQRVYPLTVTVGAEQNTSLSSRPVLVRPIVPGALVVPEELMLDVGRPGNCVSFHVTPLALGKLPEARVDILESGQTVHQVPLRMKSATQRGSWVLLLLAILVPPLLLQWTHYYQPSGPIIAKRLRLPTKDGEKVVPPVEERQMLPPGIPAPEEGVRRPGPHDLALAFFQDKTGKDEPKKDKERDGFKGPALAGVDDGPPPMDDRRGAGRGMPGGPAERTPLPDPPYEEYFRIAHGEEWIEYAVAKYLADNVPGVADNTTLRHAASNTASAVATVYAYLRHSASDLRPAFWLGMVFLALALISWVRHRPQRRTNKVRFSLSEMGRGTASDSSETQPLEPTD